MNPKDNINAVLDMAKMGIKTGHDLALTPRMKVVKTICRYLWYAALVATGIYLSILLHG